MDLEQSKGAGLPGWRMSVTLLIERLFKKSFDGSHISPTVYGQRVNAGRRFTQ